MIHDKQHDDASDNGAPSSRREFLGRSALAGLSLAALGGVAQAQMSMSGSGAMSMAGAKMASAGAELYPGAVDAQGAYVLPPLPYAYNALEPHIDEATMKLHHDKHHAAYVAGAIANETKISDAQKSGDFALLEYYTGKASFNLAGHFLHCIFWDNMAPKPGEASADLKKAISDAFGSQATWQKQFSAAAVGVEGSGWGILAWNIPAKKLVVTQARNHNLLGVWAEIPLLVVDVWEHAYYKKYSNVRGDYVNAFMNVINWDSVSKRYAAARAALG